MSVRGVAQQGGAVQKALTPAVAKYKDWAGKNPDANTYLTFTLTRTPTPTPTLTLTLTLTRAR